jgi:Fe-S cluster biogenesis protein NfuA
VVQVVEGIRPAVREDGGDVEVVEVTPEGQVRLRFKGACTACPSRDITLQHGIERNLKQLVPEVTSVVALD